MQAFNQDVMYIWLLQDILSSLFVLPEVLEQNLVLPLVKQHAKASTVLLWEQASLRLLYYLRIYSLPVLCTLSFMCMCQSLCICIEEPSDVHGSLLKTLLQPVCNGISSCIAQLVPSY